MKLYEFTREFYTDARIVVTNTFGDELVATGDKVSTGFISYTLPKIAMADVIEVYPRHDETGTFLEIVVEYEG